jgi:tRNA (adenine37-N6)-methyltransferase
MSPGDPEPTNGIHDHVRRDVGELEPIGVIHTPFGNAALAPRQTHEATGARGHVVLTEAYREGLRALDGFDYVHLIVLFDRAPSAQMTVEPLHPSAGGVSVGLFATRHPPRPNRIGLSLVKLERITDEGFEFSRVDLLNGTPLLDIKPYEPGIDTPWTLPVRSGWYAQVGATAAVR